MTREAWADDGERAPGGAPRVNEAWTRGRRDGKTGEIELDGANEAGAALV
ncbi:hypothetical protein [Burkholderia pseudomallei]|nr:hypothetical protein [Burkholderia pseudomallei]KGD54562.1 hypothetical protein DP49_1342 [Burkholderia pseudomallei]KGU77400.1 hypothetical protein Y038_708 [Burkholderia pseudomallei MSHR543]KGW04566.1 hypothetical protein X882_2932 [Burkholderia pseudomallei MSHR4303]MBM5689628.1 hypothetical protein [Burkholderia pseudomallei]UZU16571.1 hypothetical protein OSB53_08795 [Burkholderia pseudomallei]